MLKFKVTPERFAEACNILEYLAIQRSNRDVALRVLPRFLLNGDDDYIVTIVLDDDGDIERIENADAALLKMAAITPKRSEKLIDQLMEAANNIVNPPKGVDSNTPTSTDTKKPPTG